jgi:nucleoid DNA-binding protein
VNHTERINEVARQHRHLTRRLVKESVESYLELLAEEIAAGEWSEIHGIGKMQVTIEDGSGAEDLSKYPRLRTRIRLGEQFKAKFYKL